MDEMVFGTAKRACKTNFLDKKSAWNIVADKEVDT
jgi:hypothetical protein